MDEIHDINHLQRELSNTMSRIDADINRAIFLVVKFEFEHGRLNGTCEEYKRDFQELSEFLIHHTISGGNR